MNIKIRQGWKEYQTPSEKFPNGMTFIHTDVAPEYYAPGKPWNHLPHPLAWEKQITW